MIDVYLARVTRESEEYQQALLYKILELLKVGEEDGEITQDVRYEEKRSVGSPHETLYKVLYKDGVVGKIRGEIFQDGSFKIEEIETPLV